jgi:opacity protein-like surface antigen
MNVGFLAAATLTGVLIATSSLADPVPGAWYGAIDLGGHARQDAQTPSQIPELGYKPASPRFQTFKDFAGFARVGYRVLPHLRLEFEAGWRPAGMRQIVDEFQNGRPPSSITRICGDAPNPADPSDCGAPNGGVGSWTGMVNAIDDFWRLGRPEPWIHPVAGFGIGLARVHLQTQGRLFGVSAPLSPPSSIVIDDADTRFAIQFFGGLAMRINDEWSADLTYRFLHSAPHTWNTTTTGAIKLGPISGKYEDHALTLGVRRLLGSPGSRYDSREGAWGRK